MNRKEKIADVALQLFAQKGYDGTSTLLIAQQSGVSEALIFKHFGNKDHLLSYIFRIGYNRIVTQNRGMLNETDPLTLIYKAIDLPNKLIKDEPDFWKLQLRLIDIEHYEQQYRLFLQPVYVLLSSAFTRLGYEQPEQETGLLLLIIEGLWKNLAMKDDDTIKKMPAFIKSKYRRQ